MSVIRADNLSKEFDDVDALRDVSFKVDEGEIIGVLGPNGAGKSTLIKVLSGQMNRDSGEVRVLGKDPDKEGVKLREDIGILPEREDPPSFLTGKEFMDFCSDIRGEEFVDSKWVQRLNLGGDLNKITHDLSKGERQKLMIAQSFFHEPEIVFIDEPLINLDPFIQEEAKKIFQEHRDDGGTVFMCTHVVELAEELCDRVFFMDDGEIVEEVTEVENLREKFFESQ
ncbi:ABC transporter ATP-binding protein [Candidatus Nanohalobium constans]|uniref:ABC transporter ATP-binding protein n=1 Tax=Candidatus Nanohalobium constans TaxID=2565781 RepID=A0A5Q0UFQ0_9ARCH|nr:ABC transporter ATP-binding protein [Candidatus Nanohalobium constans]QGA80416.1 ABC transporter ATP-binding protein [Candidatus Nanohalobium constans]